MQVRKKQFNVLLTTYELLMSDADRTRLVKIKWAGIVVDEGHRWVVVKGHPTNT
jgi:SNF2 family DNA or RNA helicase